MRRVIAAAVALTALLSGGAFSDPTPARISGDGTHGEPGPRFEALGPVAVPVVDTRSKEPQTLRKLPVAYRQPEDALVRILASRGLSETDDVVLAEPVAPPHSQRGPPAAGVGFC